MTWECGKGNLERPSALLCLSVGLNSISYQYEVRIRAQCWSLAAANEEIPFLGLRMVINGLWSVTNVHKLPAIKVLVEFLNTKDY